MGSLATAIEHRGEVLLRLGGILVPPLSQRRHVVSRDGAYRAVGVLRQMSEPHLWVLGHGLDLERENPQLVHHPRHAVRHHAEILGTYQHPRGLSQTRQLLHGLRIPVVVIAAVEVVVVQAVEAVLLVLGQFLVGILVLHGNARMPAVGAFVVDEEQVVVTLDAVGLYLLAAQQCRAELPHETRLLGHGDLPDAEESQHMVYAVGIEVLCHLAESSHPPLAAVLQHLVPVVGGEAPVLPVGRERVGRCSCLSVQVEVLRLHPGLHAVA